MVFIITTAQQGARSTLTCKGPVKRNLRPLSKYTIQKSEELFMAEFMAELFITKLLFFLNENV